MAERWQFEKVGLGYRCWSDEVATEFHFNHIKRGKETLTGELSIRTNLANVKTNNGVLHVTRLNVLAGTTRSSLAKMLGGRTPGHEMDWFDGLETLCQNVIIAEQTGEPIIDVGKSDRTPRNEQFLVEPLVLRGRTSILFGPGGVGKSLIALTCGLSVAAHREIIPGIAPAMTGPILYLDWETTGAVINDRIQAIAAGHHFEAPHIAYRRCVKPLADEAEQLSAIVSARGIVLVIVDSTAYAMGALGEYGDANEAVLRLHEALRVLNVSALLVDHVTKTDTRTKPGSAQPYGSVFKTNAARLSWEVRKAPAAEGDMRINLYHAKSNDTAQMSPIGLGIDWSYEAITFHSTDVVAEEEEAVEGRRATWGEQIIELLMDGAQIKHSEIGRAIGAPKEKWEVVRKTVDRMIAKGDLVKDDEGFVAVNRQQPVRMSVVPGGLRPGSN